MSGSSSTTSSSPPTPTQRPLLLEIGVEELPSSFVDAALAALPGIVEARLAALRLAHGAVRAYGTPRRLAVIVDGVATRQTDLDDEVVGPPEAAAYKDGAPTRAAEAFATKLGVAVSDLTIADRPAGPKQKAGRYVIGRRRERGQSAEEVLEDAIPAIASAIPFRKSMRWGEGDASFGRPVQWLVALFGDGVVSASFAGVKSGRTSRGHRFLAPAPIDVARPDTYVEQLRAAHVLVDRTERADRMMRLVTAAAQELGGVHDPDPNLVDENASLVEEPHVVTGSFDAAFLELPAAVIRAVARGHQKYFCVQKSDEELVPRYLAIANTANRPDEIAKGNDRVMRSRLADARFFFEEDKKAKIDGPVAKLQGIVFHARLGTVREKVDRIQALAEWIGRAVGLPAGDLTHVARAAHLCKFDLVSLMVGEFPELQGHMGRVYAAHAGEDAAVADAIRDHYRPIGAQDAIPDRPVSSAVALADRIDTLVGCFAIGLQPTGAADPFALRRNCIAALRILIETPAYAALAFDGLCARAYALYAAAGKKLEVDADEARRRLNDFARERLRGLLATAASAPVADAVLGGFVHAGERAPIESYPAYAMAKAKALQGVVDANAPWLEQARTVAKRLDGISKDARPVFHGKDQFERPTDAAIVLVVDAIRAATDRLTTRASVEEALRKAEDAARQVDEIFVSTLVNDPADPLTPKRLELLSYGADCMLRIADFSRLQHRG